MATVGKKAKEEAAKVKKNMETAEVVSSPVDAPVPAAAGNAIRQQFADDIAASKSTWGNTDFATNVALAQPQEIAEAVVYGDKPSNEPTMLPEVVVEASRSNEPTMLPEVVVYGKKKEDMSPKGMLEKAKKDSTATYDKYAEQTGKEALDSNVPDFEKTQEDYQSEIQKKGFAQWAIDTKADAERRLAEDEARERESRRNAAWAGAAEMASSIANLVAVGKHNAVSQQYKNYSQDWMQKADSDARERRNRMDDLRKFQRETELKMNQITQQGIQAAIENDRRREQTRLENEYRQAQIEYQKARTEAERQEAEQKAAEAAERLKYIQAQTANQQALARQHDASAYSSITKADAYADSSRTKADAYAQEKQGKVDGKPETGEVEPAVSDGGVEDENGLFVPRKRRGKKNN